MVLILMQLGSNKERAKLSTFHEAFCENDMDPEGLTGVTPKPSQSMAIAETGP